MTTNTTSPAGISSYGPNHNALANGFRVKTALKAGALTANHNQTLAGLRVKTALKAGALTANHNQTLSGPRPKSAMPQR